MISFTDANYTCRKHVLLSSFLPMWFRMIHPHVHIKQYKFNRIYYLYFSYVHGLTILLLINVNITIIYYKSAISPYSFGDDPCCGNGSELQRPPWCRFKKRWCVKGVPMRCTCTSPLGPRLASRKQQLAQQQKRPHQHPTAICTS